MKFKRFAKRLLSPVLAAGVVVLFAATASACPSCQEALATDGGDLLSGFFYSIMFMLCMPFAILGVFSGCAYRAVRRARQTSESQGPIDPPAGR